MRVYASGLRVEGNYQLCRYNATLTNVEWLEILEQLVTEKVCNLQLLLKLKIDHYSGTGTKFNTFNIYSASGKMLIRLQLLLQTKNYEKKSDEMTLG